ncbi:MAG TPA: histidine kinase [Acidimicrobiales bacterium]|nr:histidine kinase [Acidimicrobiales bacterium]
MPRWLRWSWRQAGVEAAAWSGVALLEWSLHWSAAAVSVVPVGLAAYFRRQRPVLAAALLSVAILLPVQLGWPFDHPAGPYVALVLAIVLAYSLGSRAALPAAATGLAILLIANSGGFLWYTDGSVMDALLPVLGLGAPWVAGRVVYALRRTAGQLALRTQELEDAQEEIARLSALGERRRIARELHDVVAHGVTLMVVQAGAAERVLLSDSEAAAEAMNRVQEAGREAISELSRMLGMLGEDDDDNLSPVPSAAELPALASSVAEAGLDTHLFVDTAVEKESIPPGVGLALYRITQEALTNAMRRGVTEAGVTLCRRPPGLELEIVTGAGGDLALNGTGKGMEGMRERVALYGGELRADTLPDGGFRILVKFTSDSG